MKLLASKELGKMAIFSYFWSLLGDIFETETLIVCPMAQLLQDNNQHINTNYLIK